MSIERDTALPGLWQLVSHTHTHTQALAHKHKRSHATKTERRARAGLDLLSSVNGANCVTLRGIASDLIIPTPNNDDICAHQARSLTSVIIFNSNEYQLKAWTTQHVTN